MKILIHNGHGVEMLYKHSRAGQRLGRAWACGRLPAPSGPCVGCVGGPTLWAEDG